MRNHLIGMFIEVALMLFAIVCAEIVWDDLVIAPQRIEALAPYAVITAVTAVPVLIALDLHCSIWRAPATNDYGRVAAAVVITISMAIWAGFSLNLLEGVPRALPVVQAILTLSLMVGARIVAREGHVLWRRSGTDLALRPADGGEGDTVLIVGFNRIAELYLEVIEEFAAGQVRIAGLMGDEDPFAGRLLRRRRTLGAPEDVGDVLKTLETQGVTVSRIVVAANFGSLSPSAQTALRNIERTTSIKLELVADWVYANEQRLRHVRGQSEDAGVRLCSACSGGQLRR